MLFGKSTPAALQKKLRRGISIAKPLRRALQGYIKKEDPGRTLKCGAADTFFDELLGIENFVGDSKDLPEGMTPYISASVAAVLRMLDMLDLQKGDLLCDVGAGLFRIPILTHLLTGLPTMGVELDVSLVKKTEAILEINTIKEVEVLTGDARRADLSKANIFSFNLPFDENNLAPFLKNIKPARGAKPITIYPFCWHYVFWDVEWLEPRKLGPRKSRWTNEAGEEQYFFVSR